MIDILWQTAAAVVNGTTRSAWTFKFFFDMRTTTCSGNALFTEDRLFELCNLYNENKGLTCGGLICREIRHFQILGCTNIF